MNVYGLKSILVCQNAKIEINMSTEFNNVYRQEFYPNRDLFLKAFGHKAKVTWFTGLSGSGKSSLANEVSNYYFNKE